VRLTRREREVLEHLDRGLETAEVAKALGISSVTVRRHVSETLRKLGAPDRDTALQLLRESGA
jgi:DNA-binding NarL/FixJ family response regulator